MAYLDEYGKTRLGLSKMFDTPDQWMNRDLHLPNY